MANFPPLKRYIFYCLSRCIERFSLQGPFLDIGCGVGDVSAFLAARGWSGVAIDSSPEAIEQARKELVHYPAVRVECGDISEFVEVETYKTVVLWDCLEHIEDDRSILKKIFKVLQVSGYICITVPSNPREWGWDDVFYGHYRRYHKKDIESLLRETGFTPLVFWDFTFPFFWFMRRLALMCMRKQATSHDPLKNTQHSSLRSFWSTKNQISRLYDDSVFWRSMYWIQFIFFKNLTAFGHEIFIIAKKQ